MREKREYSGKEKIVQSKGHEGKENKNIVFQLQVNVAIDYVC